MISLLWLNNESKLSEHWGLDLQSSNCSKCLYSTGNTSVSCKETPLCGLAVLFLAVIKWILTCTIADQFKHDGLEVPLFIKL